MLSEQWKRTDQTDRRWKREEGADLFISHCVGVRNFVSSPWKEKLNLKYTLIKGTQRRIKNNTESTRLWQGKEVKAEWVNVPLHLRVSDVQYGSVTKEVQAYYLQLWDNHQKMHKQKWPSGWLWAVVVGGDDLRRKNVPSVELFYLLSNFENYVKLLNYQVKLNYSPERHLVGINLAWTAGQSSYILGKPSEIPFTSNEDPPLVFP